MSIVKKLSIEQLWEEKLIASAVSTNPDTHPAMRGYALDWQRVCGAEIAARYGRAQSNARHTARWS